MATRRRRSAGLIVVGLAAAALSLPFVAVLGIGVLAGGAAGGQTAPEPTASAAGVPERAAVAYQQAAGSCTGLDWTLLAAVGAVESDHGQLGGSMLDPESGETTPWVFGPPLDGHNNTATMPIGRWLGWWGLTGPWTRAVGPMQFLPATFESHAIDQDQDGMANPHDIDDAVATAAAYLCSTSGRRVDGPEEVARIYNPGDPGYADQLAAAQQRILTAGDDTDTAHSGAAASATICPVNGEVQFTDTFGAPRSGGRTHQGVDIFSPAGTPVVAPADGMVEHYNNQLGGLSYRLYADDDTYYYGTHLSAYESIGAGHVAAGTVIGYVGNTGNAATTPPHLHWEIHPNGQGTPAINPTPTAEALCRQA